MSARQSEILQIVRQRGTCSIMELARELAVSSETIRRNVKPLVAEGLALKVHGGVLLPSRYEEPPIVKRMQQQESAKRRIANAVARQVVNGDSLLIDTGSTTAFIAQALCRHRALTVVTNSAYIANLLASRNDNRVIMVGGELRAHDAAAFGPTAISFVKRFQARHAILSIGAVHAERGCMDYHLCEAEFSQAVIAQAEEVIVATDATKFWRITLIKVCDFDAIGLLITDEAPPADIAASLERAGTRVVVAEAKPAERATAVG